MKLLSFLILIHLGILSVNIKIVYWPFDGIEASVNNLVPGTKRFLKKSVYLAGYLLMTTDGLLIPVF